MSAAVSEHEANAYDLVDYCRPEKVWSIVVADGSVARLTQRRRADGESLHGVMSGSFAGRSSLGFFSPLLSTNPRVPDYASQLAVVAGDKVLGDGYERPEILFRRGMNRALVISTKDGWSLQWSYRMPWFRELIGRFNSAGTIDYQPADFGEHFYSVVRRLRPAWCRAI